MIDVAQRQRPVDFATEGLLLAHRVGRNCGIRVKRTRGVYDLQLPRQIDPTREDSNEHATKVSMILFLKRVTVLTVVQERNAQSDKWNAADAKPTKKLSVVWTPSASCRRTELRKSSHVSCAVSTRRTSDPRAVAPTVLLAL
jgi:hypothetical protein